MGSSQLPAGHPLSGAVSAIVRPTSIRLYKKTRLLAIEWSDGHSGEYAWDGLREACPCAGCRVGHEEVDAKVNPMVFNLTSLQAYELERIELIGNYALKLVWNDGHSAGIYTWSYLRGIS